VGALAAWKESEAAGAVSRSKYAEPFKKARFDCEGRMVRNVQAPAPAVERPAVPPPAAAPVDAGEITRAIASAEQAIRAAEQLNDAIRGLMADSLLARDWVQQSGVAAAQTRAEGFIAEAKDALETGRKDRDLKLLKTAATIAASAEQQLGLLRQAADARKAQLQADERRAAVPPPSPAANTTPLAAASIAAPRPASDNPDANLLALIDAFMQGRYADTASLARQFREATGKPGAQAALFGAAAHYSLFVRGGERDRTARDAAAEYTRRVHLLDPSLQPDPRVFSPRFVQFFRSVQ
jgi:hypothetical protein